MIPDFCNVLRKRQSVRLPPAEQLNKDSLKRRGGVVHLAPCALAAILVAVLSLRRGLLSVIVIGAVLGPAPSASVGAPGSVQRPTGRAAFPILAMGDSYSAGNGAGSYSGPAGCWRSPSNYAGLYARMLKRPPYNQPTAYANTACSGDATNAFFATIDGRRPQLDSVNKTFGLILLTTGGDDVNFAGIVKDCLITAFVEPVQCRALLTQAERLLSNGTIESRVRRVLSGIRKRADSRTTIALVGYPYLESNDNYQINRGTADAYNVGTWLRTIEDKGDVIEQRIVDRLNSQDHTHSFVFVKTKQLFAGHELSAEGSNSNRWFVEPLTDSTISSHETWYHPNPTGWAEEANLLLGNPRIPKHNPIQQPTRGAPPAAVTTPTSGPLSHEPMVTPPVGLAPSELVTRDLITGTGAEAKTGDLVTVNYVGVLYEGGKEFDSSWKRKEPYSFILGRGHVIEGWEQGLPGMKVGGRRELIIPADLAYGATGAPPAIPPYSPEVFVVDLLGT